jgi:hypothetical protein
MTRQLKVSILAVFAICMLGAADSKAGEFHCSVEPCTYTPKIAGSLFFQFQSSETSISVLCKQITGEATSAKKTATELTVNKLKLEECSSQKKGATVRTNGCDLLFKASGSLSVQGCESGKSLEFEPEITGCLLTVGNQTVTENRLAPFTSEGGGWQELGVEFKESSFSATADASCGLSKPSLTMSITGTTVFTGESGAGAMAATWNDPEFHCSAEPCRLTMKPDGEGGSETAQQRIRVVGFGASAEFLCDGVTGEATSSQKTSSELTLTSVAYQNCVNSGFPIAVRMNGCDYILLTNALTINCPAGKKIEIEGTFAFLGLCKFTVGPQGPLSGLLYHRVGEEVTVENRVSGISVVNDSSCPVSPVGLTFVTSNAVLTGETDPGGEMGRFWIQ